MNFEKETELDFICIKMKLTKNKKYFNKPKIIKVTLLVCKTTSDFTLSLARVMSLLHVNSL